MPDFAALILAALARPNYKPVKPKALARKLGVADSSYGDFRDALRQLMTRGQARIGKNDAVFPGARQAAVVGTFRRLGSGAGVVRVAAEPGLPGYDYAVEDHLTRDASQGDRVACTIIRKPARGNPGEGEVVEVVERATTQFVGSFFERRATPSSASTATSFRVAWPLTTRRPGGQDRRQGRGRGVSLPHVPRPRRGGGDRSPREGGRPRRRYQVGRAGAGIPDEFPSEALAERGPRPRASATTTSTGGPTSPPTSSSPSTPWTPRTSMTPCALTRDEASGFWTLTVHVADVGHFCRSAARSTARPASGAPASICRNSSSRCSPRSSRTTSRASGGQTPLRQNRSDGVRHRGQARKAAFFNGAIRARKRFAYEQVSDILDHPEGEQAEKAGPGLVAKLQEMRDFAMILRRRRFKRGACSK